MAASRHDKAILSSYKISDGKIMKTKFIFLALSMLLVGCLENSDEPKPGQRDIFNDNDPLIAEQKVVCEDERDCPSYINRIVFKTREGVKVCTGVLVSPSLVLTSPNCIPKEINEFVNCKDKVRVYFPENIGNPEQTSECKRIVNSSSSTPKSNDVVFIKIMPPKRRYAPRDLDGIFPDKPYSIWTVNQVSPSKGIVKKTTCTTLYNGIMAPDYSSPLSPHATFGECLIGAGNKGAPVINENGNVVGMIDQYAGQDFIEEVHNGIIPFNEKPEGLARVVNLGCMKLFENRNEDIPRSCFINPGLEEFGQNTLIYLTNEALANRSGLKDAIRDWKNSHKPQIFQWREKFHAIPTDDESQEKDFSQMLIFPDTRCMNSPQTWVRYFKRRLGGIPKSKVIEYKIPVFLTKFYFSKNGQLDYDLFTLDQRFQFETNLALKALLDETFGTRVTKFYELQELESIDQDDSIFRAEDKHIDILSDYFRDTSMTYFCRNF